MLLDLFDVVGVDKFRLIKALTNEDFDDIEDRLQVECAQAVNADYIITRNINDFTTSLIPAILPEEFLEKLAPSKWDNRPSNTKGKGENCLGRGRAV
jgi:hypothetical protein